MNQTAKKAEAHPFRFGVVFYKLRDGGGWREGACRAEALGYSTLLMPDHLKPQFGPLAALAMAAAATTKLRVGSLVFANDFRHPAFLAKEAATIDVLSDGRFELGIGTGWQQTDYDWTTTPMEPGRDRLERLAESVAILKGLMAEAPLEFAGRHYQVRGLEGTPKPAQRPHPPILIGGGGRRILQFAARQADIVDLHFLRTRSDGRLDPAQLTEESLEKKVDWVREAAGERFSNLELSMFPLFASLEPASAELNATARRLGVEPAVLADSPWTLVGSVESITEKLLQLRRQFSVSYAIVIEDFMEEFAPVVSRLAGRT